MILTIVVIILCLLLMFLQDLYFRKIHFLAPVAVFLASGYITVPIYGREFMLQNILYNILLLSVILFFLIIYMSLKKRGFANPFKNYFGLGDLLMYLSILPLFTVQNFLLFFIASMIFAVALQFLFIKSPSTATIPLAGFASLLLILVVVKDYWLDYSSLTLIAQ